MYCEIHCHTHYSLLDGASSPEALLDRAVALGMPALAITDHDGLYGVVPFWRAARARDIHPVIGAEVTLAHGSHLTLLAETQAGYANLSRLISAGQLAPPAAKGRPYLTIEDVARHAGGLLCLSGCREGAVAQAILAGDEALARRAAGKLADIFGRDRAWIELQRHWLPDDNRLIAGLRAVAEAIGLGVVATNNVHYATAEGHRLHDVLTATRHNVPLAELGTRPLRTGELQRRSGGAEEQRSPCGGAVGCRPGEAPRGGRHPASSEFYLKGEAEMAALLSESEAPGARTVSQAIAERCNVSLDFSSRRLPAFPSRTADFPHGIAPGENAFSTLHALSQAGLHARYRPVTPRAVHQLAHELTVIEKTGLADYFLIVWDIVRFARQNGIRCQGRGSAANSLVAYLLGITPVDPLRHDLLFERFLSDRTDTMPDIDIDFAADRRDEVIAYVYQRYGADHAAMVCNVVTYRERSAIRDAARALGYPSEEIGHIEALALEQMRGGGAEERGSRGAGEQGSGGAEERGSGGEHLLRALSSIQLPTSPNPPIPACVPLPASGFQLLIDLATQLIGTPRHLSVHVGGILITAQPLVEVVPLERATKPGIVVAQWNKDAIEDAGLIKIDLLSLRTLGMLTEACAWIERPRDPSYLKGDSGPVQVQSTPSAPEVTLSYPSRRGRMRPGEKSPPPSLRAGRPTAPRHETPPAKQSPLGRSELAPEGGFRLDLDALPLDDPAVYKLMAEGDAIGCFQVESRAQAQMLPRLKPACFEDLIIEVSIVRPGPIQGGMVHPYLRRRQGIEPVTYLHPLLEPILRETLGVIIFQEQVIRVAVALAGFTPGEADLLRRAMSRGRSTEAMAELRQRFLAGAESKGVDREIAEEAFRQLQGFATYGFCKSHAAAFALIAYQTLWLKAYHPAEFYCALLNHQPMGFYSPEVVVNDARRHGITVLRPDVNRSEDGCTLEQGSGGAGEQGSGGAEEQGSRGAEEQRGKLLQGASSERHRNFAHGAEETGSPQLLSSSAPQLRLGLRYLHGLGEAGRARLLAERGARDFADLADFCRRTSLPRPLIRDLIRAGALDGLGGPRRQMLWTLGGLHYEEEVLVEAPEIPTELPELAEREALRWDYELLGLSPDDHPMRLWRARLQARGVVSAAELAAETPGKVVEVAGMVIVRQAPPTAKGHLFITLEDETGLANLIIRPDLYERERVLLRGSSALLAGGVVQREGKASPQKARDSTSMLVRWVKALKALG
jgi:error-prone DNA polymerase